MTNYMENKEPIERDKKKLIANNNKCQDLISKYRASLFNTKMSYNSILAWFLLIFCYEN